ncbi:MAG: alpha/beta hydrolase [Candidatus Nanopelagicales bacterium]|nr:alpha/beta hydrolase [Candidatus Nanopelagicales bacterium]
MKSFLFIHGAWHGAWCWDPVRELLTQAGITSLAIELPGDQPGGSIGTDAALAFAAMDEMDGDVIVVGHSLAGLVAPFVATHPKAAGVVMVAALFPEFDVSAAQQRDRNPDLYTEHYRSAQIIRHEDGSTEVPMDEAIALMFNTCEPEVARWAASQLRRQYWESFVEPSPLWAWPEVPTLTIACTQDELTNPEPMRRATQQIAAARYVELECDHSPMLSMTKTFADLLIHFSE